MLKYIKTAFLNQWNLLLFAGGMGFAALSGRPDITIPLVLAGEAAYLGLLGTHPKFQSFVEKSLPISRLPTITFPMTVSSRYKPADSTACFGST